MNAVSTPSSRPGGAASLVGTVIGDRYKLDRVIGEGAMSAVYAAEHIHMHKPLAVKVLSPQMSQVSEAVTRFKHEAMAASRIDHPNVAAATDFGELDDGSFFLVLELVEGQTLREIITSGKMPATRALHITRQIVSALVRAHALGIVHRDLKPENVMLTTRGDDTDFVKVLDFGIAKIPMTELAPAAQPAAPLTTLGLVYGTPEYMAPEQAMGTTIDARADLYAVGVIIFEMLAGVRPWDDENKAVLLGKHVSQPIPAIADRAPDANVPPEVEAIVKKAMAKLPKDRYETAADMLAAIDAIAPAPQIAPSVASFPRMLKTAPLPAARAPEMRPYAPWKRIGIHLIERAEARLPLERIPLPLSPRQKLAVLVTSAASLLGLLVAIIVVLSIAHSDRTSAAGGASSAAASVDHRARCLAASSAGDSAAVLREATAWIAANPHAESDEIAHAVAMAASGDQETSAFELLENKLGRAGADALYDLAYGTSALQPTVSARAKQSLQHDAVKAHMSRALSITLAIRASTNICDTKTKYFTEAASAGDARTAEALSKYLKHGGCGRHGRVDCYPCLRTGSDSVDKTVAAIRARGDGGT